MAWSGDSRTTPPRSKITAAIIRGARRAPTIVVLVRHGKTSTTGVLLPGRRPGLHLDDEGRRQADASAQRLAKLRRIDAVYSSPLERARETAAPIARARGLS